jgi:hypothetical protein
MTVAAASRGKEWKGKGVMGTKASTASSSSDHSETRGKDSGPSKVSPKPDSTAKDPVEVRFTSSADVGRSATPQGATQGVVVTPSASDVAGAPRKFDPRVARCTRTVWATGLQCGYELAEGERFRDHHGTQACKAFAQNGNKKREGNAGKASKAEVVHRSERQVTIGDVAPMDDERCVREERQSRVSEGPGVDDVPSEPLCYTFSARESYDFDGMRGTYSGPEIVFEVEPRFADRYLDVLFLKGFERDPPPKRRCTDPLPPKKMEPMHEAMLKPRAERYWPWKTTFDPWSVFFAPYVPLFCLFVTLVVLKVATLATAGVSKLPVWFEIMVSRVCAIAWMAGL